MIRNLFIIAFASLNLRTVLAALGAGSSELTAVMHSSTVTGAASTVSVFAVALAAPLSGVLARRFASRHAVLAGLIGTSGAFLLLGIPAQIAVWGAVVLAGLSSGLCGTLLPSIMRDIARGYVGKAAAVMMVSSALGLFVASITVTWAIAHVGSWVASLLVLAGAALLAALFWASLTRRQGAASPPTENQGRIGTTWWAAAVSAWRVQWVRSLTFFVGIQSFVLFAQLAWVAHSAVAVGIDLVDAGTLLSIFTGLQVVGGVIAPWLLDRGIRLSPLLLTTSSLIVIGTAIFAGVTIISNGAEMPLLAVACLALALGHGGAYAVANAILALASRSANDSATNSSVVMFLSQAAGAFGPLVLGQIFDATEAPGVPWLLLFALCVLIPVFGAITAAHAPKHVVA